MVKTALISIIKTSNNKVLKKNTKKDFQVNGQINKEIHSNILFKKIDFS